jgi:hypothetical protein
VTRERDAVIDQMVDEEERPQREAPPVFQWATIDAVNGGDTPPSVDINLNGSVIPAVRYPSWYSPTVDDQVAVTPGPDVYVVVHLEE